MKILMTGAKGFIGKNLISALNQRGYQDILAYDIDTGEEWLEVYTRECEFVFHLAGINRPEREEEFVEGNCAFADRVLQMLEQHGNRSPVLMTSSIQAEKDHAYGRSKKAGEDVLRAYSIRTGVEALIYRLPNVFGKWCRPNYNSAVATFCHNISRDLPIQVSDPNVDMQLVYIDDVVEAFIGALEGKAQREGDLCVVPVVHRVKLGEIVRLLGSFRESRTNLSVPKLDDPFAKALYSTYLSYLPEDQFGYPLKMNVDARGSFTEIIRTSDRGQFSVNISKSGITKGNHWHHTKTEKFVVVSGTGLICLRKIGTSEVIRYPVTGQVMQVVDIPPGYTHNITNTGETDLITFMWCNECFDPERPDTYFEEVE